ncbi:MAG: hypothetical protein QXI22_06035 [Sulfolobales archaeon]
MRIEIETRVGGVKGKKIQDMGPNERSPEAEEAKGRTVGIKINRNEARTPATQPRNFIFKDLLDAGLKN